MTHDQREAMALSDRIMVMKNGMARQIDTPFNVYTHPANKFVFSFIGLSNFTDVAAENGRGYVKDADLILPYSGKKCGGLFAMATRLSEIDVVTEGGLCGDVVRRTCLGDIEDYSVKVDEQFLRVQKGRSNVRLNEGEICELKFKHPFWYDADQANTLI